MRRLWPLWIFAAAACDHTTFRDCEIQCTLASGCPDGFLCGGEGRCRLAGAAGTCGAVGPDASIDPDAAGSCAQLDCDDHAACTIDTCVAGPPASCKHEPVAVHSSQVFDFTGAIDAFTAPACVTQLTIEASGAQGGSGGTLAGGKGARITGTFAIASGVSLSVLVGGQGQSGTSAGGGGGGSFVWLGSAPAMPLIAAGGGGGAADGSCCSGNKSAGIGGAA